MNAVVAACYLLLVTPAAVESVLDGVWPVAPAARGGPPRRCCSGGATRSQWWLWWRCLRWA